MSKSSVMVKTGKLPVTLFTAAAILALSLVVNLPGLAITPMLGTLSEVFPKTTQIEKQLLTVLPNLLIIPFVLLSGKLSLSRHKIAVVCIGLVIYAASGVAYLFAASMSALITISCLVGVGAGLIIPFSTGLIADVFAGEYRMKVMGFQSGISNMTLVVCTFVVGWLSHGNWHLPFLVYLIPLVPLCMAFGLKGIPEADLKGTVKPTVPVPDAIPSRPGDIRGRFYVKKIISLTFIYFFLCYSTIIISYYCPFLIEKKDWSPELTGTITAVFFLFIFLPGFMLPLVVKALKGNTILVSALSMTAGLAAFAFWQVPWVMCVGAALCGLGYGVVQPLIYDKASRTVSDPVKATLALSIVLSANYIGVVLTPFIVDGLRSLFHARDVMAFSFILNFSLMVVFVAVALFCRRSFAFSVPEGYYRK